MLKSMFAVFCTVARDFPGAGGEEMTVIPCLNTHPAWISAVLDLVKPFLGSFAQESAEMKAAAA
jgi:hypothetical protein